MLVAIQPARIMFSFLKDESSLNAEPVHWRKVQCTDCGSPSFSAGRKYLVMKTFVGFPAPPSQLKKVGKRKGEKCKGSNRWEKGKGTKSKGERRHYADGLEHSRCLSTPKM
jgi:hypothetical protein